LFVETRNDRQHIDLLKGKGFLLVDDKEQLENVPDKKVEPAVPDEKEDLPDDRQEKKNEQVNPGVCIVQCTFFAIQNVRKVYFLEFNFYKQIFKYW